MKRPWAFICASEGATSKHLRNYCREVYLLGYLPVCPKLQDSQYLVLEDAVERSEYTAAKNYIRNGMYREALNALSGVPMSERDGKWYYLSAGANMYMGNKVTALEHAKRAVEIETGNEEYRRLLEQLQSGRDFYDSYSTGYGHRVNLSPLWLALCGSQLLCGQTCGCPMIYCF